MEFKQVRCEDTIRALFDKEITLGRKLADKQGMIVMLYHKHEGMVSYESYRFNRRRSQEGRHNNPRRTSRLTSVFVRIKN